ncbi:hypothetical protein VSH64_22280 [Amycolatopsis rhabdoformis]|uniref:Uncharacterized protein n=1 Tax=Amycolatopsis rhabdoformis TaxID=1448059 RepID=A0ABZ1IMM0_9PSEU|nr:hypothetical protein [Amycolatopsis rhabdoformis]WSE34774.1 hypothetical protein VSH64_22280 [Amycolatopsis rhabdoformis]
MRFSTDDGRFGLVVDPVASSGMSRFQLVVEARSVGEAEPEFAYGAFEELGNRPTFSDERLGRLIDEPDAILEALRIEEALHDPATVSLTEAQDRWFVQCYVYRGDVVTIARRYRGSSPSKSALISVVDCAEYALIVETAREYWAHDDERFRSKTWRVKF